MTNPAIVTIKVTPREFGMIVDALDMQAEEYKANREATPNTQVGREWQRKHEETARLAQRLRG